MRLDLPAAYVSTSPLSRTLDLLSLLSIPQSVWLLCVFAFLVIAGAAWTARREPPRRVGVRVLRTFLFVFASIVVTEALVILLPRPMAKLVVSDPQVVRVDFHSHTKASHDAYQQFTEERNRDWHQSGGFDIAFITDHVKWWGAMEARPRNPSRAGERVSLLTAVEGHYHKVSTIMLALTREDTAILTGWGELQHGTPSIGRQPVTIAAIPGKIDSVAAAVADTFPQFTGLELVDAAPRGLGQLDSQEHRIREIASRNRLLLVSSSNNHGWGRTVAAWNLIRIPGWRSLSPDSVGRLIEEPFRARDTTAVTIIKRLRPRTHGTGLPFTFPIAASQTIGSLTMPERGVWLAWIWLTTAVVAMRRRRST
ncbi:MAG TPA: hypothetical protein VM053_04435 [Gemmatimonadaceae bacterium]|nr:hypothetical protein [Gemmatimonadaceae bacterium]